MRHRHLILWAPLAAALAFAPSARGGDPATHGIHDVESQAETEVGATGNRDSLFESFLPEYEHRLERITPAGEEGGADSSELATQSSRVQSTATSLSMTSRGEAVLEAPRHVGLGVASFNMGFQSDVPVNVTFTATITVEAPGNEDSSDAQAFLSCGCDSDDGEGEECTVEDVDLEVVDAPGFPRTASITRSGRSAHGCSVSLSVSTSLGAEQSSARATWTASLSASTESAPEAGKTFRYVGPAQGSFGDESSWEDENGQEGVPGFRSFEDADTAIVQSGGSVSLDLAGALSRSPRGPGFERRLGRAAIRSAQTLRPLGGTLLLDSLEPGIAERSLEVGSARVVLDQGGVKARHVILGQGGDGELEVVGPDGFFTTAGRFGLGGDADGRVVIRGGAQVTSAETVLGEADGQGSAVVEGAGTLWQTGNLAVGFADAAGLTVDAGARVESQNAYVDCRIAEAPNVSGCAGLAGEEQAAATITGADGVTPSTWALTGDLEIGARGKVSVEGGAAIEADIVRIGTSGNEADCLAGKACLQVDEGKLSAQAIGVAVNGDGKLQIGPAGRVSSPTIFFAGSFAGTRGKVVVTGPSAEPQLEAPLSVGTALGGAGEMRIENGGIVVTNGGFVGGEPGSSGLVEIVANGAAPDATVLRVASGSTLALGEDLEASDLSIFGPTGEVALANGRVELEDADLDIHHTGLVSGTGRIDGFGVSFVTNGGRIGCGVVVNAVYAQTPDGVLDCPQASLPAPTQLSPLAASRFARAARKKPAPAPPPSGPFVVGGDATLDGTLALGFLNGFAPSLGDSFEILDVSGTVTGAFANVAVTGLAPGTFSFASDVVDGKLVLTSETDASPLPPLSLKAKTKLKETAKGGLKVKIKRGGDLSSPLTVAYRLAGTAKNGVDYATVPLAIEIPARKRAASVVFRPIADAVAEGTETLALELLPGDGYSLPFVRKVSAEILEPKPKRRR